MILAGSPDAEVKDNGYIIGQDPKCWKEVGLAWSMKGQKAMIQAKSAKLHAARKKGVAPYMSDEYSVLCGATLSGALLVP